MNQGDTDLIIRHLTAENAHDLEGTLATLHRDCVFEDHATGQVWHGHEGASAHYRQWWQAFDVKVVRGLSQSAYWASADTYVAQATWRATISAISSELRRPTRRSGSVSWYSSASGTA